MLIEYLQSRLPEKTTPAHARANRVQTYLWGLDGETHSMVAANIFCQLSTWAYSDLATFASVMCSNGLIGEYVGITVQNQPTFVDTTAYLFVSADRRVMILTFRGTGPTNIYNWLSNMSTSMNPTEEGSVHAGFQNAAYAVMPFLRDLFVALLTTQGSLREAIIRFKETGCIPEAVFPQFDEEEEEEEEEETVVEEVEGEPAPRTSAKQMPWPGEPRDSPPPALYICGHSLGGAYAAMAGALIALDPEFQWFLGNLKSIYTFGQPMFADRTLAETLQAKIGSKTFRHRYGKDIVPRLPARTQGRYAHFGRSYTDSDGGWLRGRDRGPVLGVVGGNVTGVLAWFMKHIPSLAKVPMPVSWGDHSPLNYLRTSQTLPIGRELLGAAGGAQTTLPRMDILWIHGNLPSG